MTPIQPVSSPYADLFVWKSTVTIASMTGASPGPNDTATDQLQFLQDSFFALYAITGSTNYDNYFPTFPIGSSAYVFSEAKIPNNFAVLITQNADQKLMQAAMPQACLCGSGYTPGNQFPFPMILPPMTSMDFEYSAIMPFNLYQADDQEDLLPLEISLGLYGYNVPIQNLPDFLASWPEMMAIASQNNPTWGQAFTSMTIPGLTS